MGNDQTTLQLKDSNRLNISKYVEISAEHNKKILYKNLKPVKEFTSIIKSIHVRSTYLKYDWAQWLCVQLQKSPNKLYEQYCEMFKMALIKKKDGFESFLVKNLDLKFLVGFENNTRKLQTTNFGEKDLQKMFDEVKCYFMVESWFSELPLNNYLKIHQTTLSSKQNQNSDKSTQFSKGQKCTVSKSHANEEKIYRTLLKLTEMHFEHKYNELSEDSISPQCQSPKKNPMKFFNSKELTLVKMISKQPSFKLRQRYIVDLIESIFKNEHPGPQDNIQLTYQETRKIFALTRVLGLKNSYCVLKILSELGQTGHFEKIEAVFNYIIKILNVQCSQAKERRSQSPEKRKTHSKTKLESIR